MSDCFHAPNFIVTGADGQDGWFLSKILQQQGNVIGITRSPGSARVTDEFEVRKLKDSLHQASHRLVRTSMDLSSESLVNSLIGAMQPSAVFHLAAVHGPSGRMPKDVASRIQMRQLHVVTTSRFLHSIMEYSPHSKFIFATTSRMYSVAESSRDVVVDENTPLNPSDYYGETKAEAFVNIRRLREVFGVNSGSAILFNHESPRRKPGFLSHHLAQELTRIMREGLSELSVRDANARADWSDARDVVAGMHAMSLQDKVDDFVLASGRVLSVADLVTGTCQELGLGGSVKVTSTLLSSQKPAIRGDWSRARHNLGWGGTRSIFETLGEMTLKLLTLPKPTRLSQ